MAMKMFKGQDSEIVNSRDVRARMDDGWTFKPSTEATLKPKRKSKNILKVKDVDIKQSDLQGPEDFNNNKGE